MRFKQLPGTSTHVQTDADGVERTYNAGDIVTSETDLAKKWPEKFQLLDESKPKLQRHPGESLSDFAARAKSEPVTPREPPVFDTND